MAKALHDFRHIHGDHRLVLDDEDVRRRLALQIGPGVVQALGDLRRIEPQDLGRLGLGKSLLMDQEQGLAVAGRELGQPFADPALHRIRRRRLPGPRRPGCGGNRFVDRLVKQPEEAHRQAAAALEPFGRLEQSLEAEANMLVAGLLRAGQSARIAPR